MTNISIFCKSYLPDLDRAREMAISVQRHNRDQLPLYFSVPELDLPHFKMHLSGLDINWVTDEAVIAANPRIPIQSVKSLPGHISQQIIKSEFWRLNPVENYLCIDSDSIFIRDFSMNDFISPNGHPYTIMHEGKEFLHFCTTHNLSRQIQAFREVQKYLQNTFTRTGVLYNFGPFPVIWNRKVWQDLDSEMLLPLNKTLLDAICQAPSEGFWYGEALLKFGSISLMPREPLFKVYLFLEEFEEDAKNKVDNRILAENYLGVVLQSNWYPKRLGRLSNLSYKIKKYLRLKFPRG